MRLEGSLTEETVNQNLLNIRYAVRGPIVERAKQIERELMKGVPKPFTRVVRANIGDCHALGQKPITFIRQVVALAACPEMIPTADVPADVKERAREILADCTAGSVGAYSPPEGLRVVRARAAQCLAARDGVPAAPPDILLGAGATDLIKAVLALFAQDVDGKPPAVLVPVPQYPLFSGALAELGVARADYFLDEARGWALCVHELRRALARASVDHTVRAIIVINPGNPTGQVLSRENVEEVVKFAYEHKLFILADEVYQENIISKPFHSFKKVTVEMGSPYSDMELASFLTLSKGWAAECGLRAALVELRGLARGAGGALRNARALAQCPGVLGQAALHCVLRPPRPGEPSYAQFNREREHIRRVLCARAAAAHHAFNSIPGFSCNPIDGSMFAFPRMEIPARAQAAAADRGMTPDEFYCLQLLEETGVCVVAGSGFGQAAGSFHLRTTILHERDELRHILDSIRTFHAMFLLEYQEPIGTDTT